jgi:hypothetical protein
MALTLLFSFKLGFFIETSALGATALDVPNLINPVRELPSHLVTDGFEFLIIGGARSGPANSVILSSAASPVWGSVEPYFTFILGRRRDSRG